MQLLTGRPSLCKGEATLEHGLSATVRRRAFASTEKVTVLQ
jgi:hypothetical protein